MRLITLIATSFLACASARAEEWNLYSPCSNAGFGSHEREYLEEERRCDPAELARIHAEFAAPPMIDLAGEGGQAVRVTVTDGYGRRLVVAEAVRRAGAASAVATARGRGDPGRRPPEAISASLDEDAWDAITRRARAQARARATAPLIDWEARRLADEEEEESITICMHGWSVLAETFGFGSPRVIERSSCDENSDAEFALGWRTMRYVFGAFPACNWLDPDFFRNDAARLYFCLGLSGETAVAASATNAIRPFLYDRFASPRLRGILADDFSLMLDGEQAVTGADAAFEHWRAFAATGEFELSFELASGAEDERGRDTADMKLFLVDGAWPHEGQTRFAEVTMLWRREDEMWLLQSLRVEPWQILTFEDDD